MDASEGSADVITGSGGDAFFGSGETCAAVLRVLVCFLGFAFLFDLKTTDGRTF